MPQGKLKVKAKLPTGVKNKSIAKKRSSDFQKKNRPALPKKGSNTLREAITKSINEANEAAAKEKAVNDGKTFRVLPNEEQTSSKEGK